MTFDPEAVPESSSASTPKHVLRHALPACVWLVIPCYNESEALDVMPQLLLDELDRLVSEGMASPDSRILFVDDGSSDGTWDKIWSLSADHERVCGLSLSRNRGHQNALMAGLMAAKDHCDAAISLDADGQDDIGAMSAMLAEYASGHDVVYGVRSNRETDPWFKRASAEAFYRLLDSMDVEVVFNHADYRLMSARALEALSAFTERNIYLRGLVPLIGFPSAQVEYERAERTAGKTHYSFRKMLSLAIDGITSLSTAPIRMVVGAGFIVTLFGLLISIWSIVMLCLGRTVAGWASLICVVALLGGMQLVSVGIIGEYVGKTYLEVKRRPRYIESERTWEGVGQRR